MLKKKDKACIVLYGESARPDGYEINTNLDSSVVKFYSVLKDVEEKHKISVIVKIWNKSRQYQKQGMMFKKVRPARPQAHWRAERTGWYVSTTMGRERSWRPFSTSC